jgi:hypothetical protein
MKDYTEPSAATPPAELPSYWMELYKLTVEMADRISGRRATANTFFSGLNTGLAAFVSGLLTAFQSSHGPQQPSSIGLYVVCAAGLVLSIAWWSLLRSYRRLNGAKFIVIHRLEEPFRVKPFVDEWDHLKRRPLVEGVRRKKLRYLELGIVEQVVPLVFAAIYAGVLVAFLVGEP